MVGVIGYSSNLLPLQRKGKQEVSIVWLSRNECLKALPDKVGTLVGKARKLAWQIMREWADQCTETVREREIILYVLGDFFRFRPKDPFAFKYPLKGKAIPRIKSLAELRVEIFSKRFSFGVEEGDDAIRDVLPDVGGGNQELKENIWADYSQYEVLQQIRKKPSVEQVIGLANFYSLVVLCRFIVEGTVEINGGVPGSVIKTTVFVAKRNGVFVDFVRAKKKRRFVARVLPGNKERGSHGQQNAIARVVGIMIRELLRTNTDFLFSALVKHPQFKNLKKFSVSSAELKEHFVDKGVESITRDFLAMDSKEERVLFEEIRKNAKGWIIHGDPEVILVEDFMYVPDFVAEQGGRKVLIELAGFYTAEYLERKAEKLREVERKHLLVVLVPENNKLVFEQLSSPVITYRKKPSWQRLLRVLENTFSQIGDETDLRLKVMEAVLEKGKAEDCLGIDALQQATEVSEETFRKWLFSEKNKELFRKQGYLVIPPNGIMKEETWRKIKHAFWSLFEGGAEDLEEYENIIPSTVPKEWVPSILQTYGFDITYKDFVSPKVTLRGKNRKTP